MYAWGLVLHNTNLTNDTSSHCCHIRLCNLHTHATISRLCYFQSANAEKLGHSILKALSAMNGEFPHYRQTCLLISATCPALTLVSVRLLSAGRPTFQLATLVTLGVLVSELWWSVSRIDGAGGWRPHARVTGEAVMAVIGGLLIVGGLVAWLSFAEKKEEKGLELAACEFDVYRVQQNGGLATTKYRWPQPVIA